MSTVPRDAADLERRIAALEAEVARMKERTPDSAPWWQRVAGTFANDPLFEEAMRLGREYRRSLRPGRVRRKPAKIGKEKGKGNRP